MPKNLHVVSFVHFPSSFIFCQMSVVSDRVASVQEYYVGGGVIICKTIPIWK
jgi:hypothetical protein